MTAYLPNGCLKATDVDVLRQFSCVLPLAFSHLATAFSKCHLPLACAIFLQDLDPCLAYKASSRYLLSFVLNISNKKRLELKDIFVLLLLISLFSSLLAHNVFVLVFGNFFYL